LEISKDEEGAYRYGQNPVVRYILVSLIFWIVMMFESLLCITNHCVAKPLKLQNPLFAASPREWPERLTDADVKKFMAIQKSEMARPLINS
jgi:hypothetical protein